ncbi:cytochrome o ubiquinol oxidase subunit 2 [Paenibacillus phyllosphaerae]|uniref:Quinol oxidase subunit 2 n=1 Tax=Paenibacillus phyllosphaerae TaxID=274593 RepID=A0A7W5AXB3_9BACL|nr:cytochrome o ubiquinol oxidase subunit 2 [Paenibacillus phyllosphaerae]
MKKPSTLKRITAALMLVLTMVLLSGCNPMVLDPKGPIGESQKDLIYISTLLCAIIIVPVLILTVIIVWRYRDKPDNKAGYAPKWEHSTKLEVIWWGIPIIIIAVLAVVTVKYTYDLEPSKAIESEKEPLTIEVTSLDWKWLFTYPEQGIATVNYLKFPEDRPIKFKLTSDAPMNSFWIPELGGQIYTMSGMAMTLYLQADEPGVYYGAGANFSGEHFGKMRFDATAISDEEFESWVQEVKGTSEILTQDGYNKLSEQSTVGEVSYSAFPEGLFDSIVMKYVTPGSSGHHHGGEEEEKEGESAEAQQQVDQNKMSMDMETNETNHENHADHQ